jgi:hypothetical protein
MLAAWWLAGLLVASLSMAPAGHAGIMDRVKKKVADKTKTAEEKADKAIDKATGDSEPAEAAPAEGEAAGSEGAKTAPGEGGKVSSVSTRFDFVPGDKVIFWDDYTQDELGEFPARWDLKMGTREGRPALAALRQP